jgi:uncharacterized protein (DUF983 family)
MSRALRLFGRAFARRCPACGGGALFRNYFELRPACPSCGLRLEREEGYFLGAMLLNLLVAEGLFVVGVAVVLLRTWPTPPWTLLTYGSAAAVVLFPIVLYPFSKTVWLALDLLVQPPRADEREARR